MKTFFLLPGLLLSLFLCSSFLTFDYSLHPLGHEPPDNHFSKIIANLDCKEVIEVNEINDKAVQYLKTKAVTLVQRGNYTYQLELIHDNRGIVAKVYSYRGLVFNKGDQLFFMDESGRRFPYLFIENGTNTSEDGKSIHFNTLKLDQGAVDWLASTNITTIYVKNNQKNELHKFTIEEEQRAIFKTLANCFKLNLRSPN